MEAEDIGVIEAARAIRPYLPRLLGISAAAELDGRLAEELTGISDSDDLGAAAGRLRALLGGQEDTAWFLAEVLRDAPDHRPPYHQPRYTRRQTGGTAAPPSPDPGPIGATRYACPHGDYVWYRPDVATPVPDCPTHHAALTRG
jgi:hypothetical protein